MGATERLRVPLARGVGEDMDPRVREASKLIRAQNVYSPVAGRLEKRNGFKPVSRNRSTSGQVDAEGPVRGLAHTETSDGGELLILGHRTLYAYHELEDKWIDRGRVSPCVPEIREQFRGGPKYNAADVSVGTEYMLYAAEAERLGVSTASTQERYLEVQARSIATGEVVMRDRLLLVTSTVIPRAPRCFFLPATNTHYIVFAQDLAAPGNLLVYKWPEATPFTSPVDALGAAATTNLYLETGRPARTFDGVPFNGGWAIAWIDNTTFDIELASFDDTDTPVDTATITGDAEENYIRVGLEDGTASLFVIAVQDFVITTLDEVHVFARSTDLTPDWGPTLLQTGAADDEFDNVSCKVVNDSAGTSRLTCSWMHFTSIINVGASDFCRSVNATVVKASGAIQETAVYVPNMVPIGRPFGYRNRVYQHLSYNVGASAAAASPLANNAIGFCHHMLIDWATGGAGARQPNKMAAMWDVGLAVPASEILRNGNCAQWTVLDDNVTFVGMFPGIAEAIPGEPTDEIDVAWDEVRLEFDAPILAAPCLPGCLVFGGGFVGWYDGVETMELHMPTAFLDSLTEVNGTGGLADGTYFYSVLLEHQDHAGILHRSPPSPLREITIGGGGSQHIQVRPATYQLSHHDLHYMGWRYYRSSTANATQLRISKSNSMGDNLFTADRGEAFEDGLFHTAVPVAQLYTTGGVIPTVSPEGAQVPLVAGEMLWLGAFARRARVQFSRRITPDDANSVIVAPQMLELQGRVLLGGEQVRGLFRVDDSVGILTQNRIYIVSGEPPDPTGAFDATSRAIELPTDAGSVDPRSVVSYPGGALFRSTRCFYKFTRGQGLEAVGERIRLLSDQFPTTTSAVVVPERQQVRFTVTTAAGGQGRILVYDYRIDEWFEWNVLDSGGSATAFVGATLHNGTYCTVESDGTVWRETETYFDDTTRYIESDVWTGWLQSTGPGSWQNVTRVDLLGDRRDACSVSMEVYLDYDTATPVETITWTNAQIDELPAPATRLELAHDLQVAQGQAVSIRLRDTSDTPVTGAGFAMVELGFNVVPRGGSPRGTRQAVV